jgi:hypothetical protein
MSSQYIPHSESFAKLSGPSTTFASITEEMEFLIWKRYYAKFEARKEFAFEFPGTVSNNDC